MKFKALFLRFLMIKNEYFWQIAARSLTFDCRKLKLMCYSNTFSKKYFLIFCHRPLWIPKDVQLLSFFSKNNTWFLLMLPTSPRYFLINLKPTWSTFNIFIKKFVILMTSWDRGWQKVLKFWKSMVSDNDF